MLQAATQPTPSPAPEADRAPGTLASRFGEIALDPERVIVLPAGIVGFAHCTRYVLSELPGRAGAFKLLQAVDDPDLSFLVLPLDSHSGPIAATDLAAACRGHGFAPASTAALAIVTLRRDGGGVRCTANLKAPLLIETMRRIGCQHVLTSDAYDVRHPVALG